MSEPSNIDRAAGDPTCVVDVYVHVAVSNRPKLRYLVGGTAYFLGYTVGILPTCVGDFLFKMLGMASNVVKPAKAVA